MKKLNAVLVGICHEHAMGKYVSLKRMTDAVNLVGVVDERSFCKAPHYPEYTSILEKEKQLSLEEALNFPGLDLACIEVPNNDLVEIAMPFAKRGIALHVDKSCGESMEPYRELLKLCEEKNLPFQMGYMFRGSPAFQFVIKLCKEGVLGDICQIQADMSHCYGDARYQEYTGKCRGGLMQVLGCHLIDIIISIMGRPEKVIPVMKEVSLTPGVFNNCTAILEYPHAIASVTSCSYDRFNSFGRRMRICGTNGALEFSPLERFDGQTVDIKLRLLESRGYLPAGYPQTYHFGPQEDRYESQLRELVGMIRGEVKDSYTREHDLLVHEISLAASGLL